MLLGNFDGFQHKCSPLLKLHASTRGLALVPGTVSQPQRKGREASPGKSGMKPLFACSFGNILDARAPIGIESFDLSLQNLDHVAGLIPLHLAVGANKSRSPCIGASISATAVSRFASHE
jgi:hypothetical protein